MKIDIFCAGSSNGEEFSIMGGAGVVLVFIDAHDRSQLREFHFALGGSDQELSEIQAVRLALASVLPSCRGAKTVLHLESLGLAERLKMGTHQDTPTKEALRWYGYYRNIEITVHSEPQGHLLRAVELARIGRDTQRDFDSLTIGVNNG